MQLPGPVRAYVGLLALAAEQAKRLPDRAIEFPMLAVSTALQMSLRAQQRYAHLTARGDEVLHRRQTGDEPPLWATFDDPVPDVGEAPLNGTDTGAAGQLLDDIFTAEADARGKTINAPRHTAPSKFDTVGESPDDD
jgi:hypothetical protein